MCHVGVQSVVWVLVFSQLRGCWSSVSCVGGKISQLCRCWDTVDYVGAGFQLAGWLGGEVRCVGIGIQSVVLVVGFSQVRKY